MVITRKGQVRGQDNTQVSILRGVDGGNRNRAKDCWREEELYGKDESGLAYVVFEVPVDHPDETLSVQLFIKAGVQERS